VAALGGCLSLLGACSAAIESAGLEPEPTGSPASSRDPRSATDAQAPDAGTAGEADAGFSGGPTEPAPPPAENSPPPPAPSCGPPPYYPVRLGARDIMAPKSELARLSVTLKHCPGQSFPVTGESTILYVTAGAETWIRYDAPGYIPWVEGELRVPDAGAVPYIEAMLMPQGVADFVMPVWKPDAPTIYVEVRTGRASADEACRSAEGVALAVKDLPTAVVLYRNKGANADYGSGPGTSAEGVAIVTNLPVGTASVELVASKPGCVYMPAFGDANSAELVPIVRAPLFAGAITHQVINPAR
jgi:hypothetical protein